MRALLVFLVLPLAALGDIIVLPDITRETLVGVWEAAMPTEDSGIATALYRMEIARDGDSYLVAIYAGPDIPQAVRFVARLTAAEVSDAKINLRFKMRRYHDDKDEDLIFQGSGVSQDDRGAIHGKFTAAGGKPFTLFEGDIWFHKGSWTRQFEEASKKAERHIRQLRNQPKT
jgi:hypothetical protein